MSALQALNETLLAHLLNAGVWEGRVYGVEDAPSTAVYPYLLWFWSGGGGEQQTPGRDTQRLQMTVKGVCGEQDGITDPKTTALTMQGAISDLLMDSGTQDVNPRLPAHATWEILTVTKGRIVGLRVPIASEAYSYHYGHIYTFLIEKK